MEECRAKFDRFKKLVNDTVKPEHCGAIEPLMKLQAEDLIVLIKIECPHKDVAVAIDYILEYAGLPSAVLDTYPAVAIEKFKRYIEYFFTVASII